MRKTTPYGIRFIAEQLGLSSSTVSRALNNHPQISRETRLKVLHLARRLGRPVDQAAPNVILLILPALRFRLCGYSNEIIDAMRQECRRRGFVLEMIAADQLEILNDRDYAGAVCIDFSLRTSRFWGKHYAVPLVALNDFPNHLENIYTVSSDSSSAFTAAIRHLVRYGHRRIGMLQFANEEESNLNAKERRNAFFQVMDSFALKEGAFCGNMDVDDNEFKEFHAILKNGVTALIVCGEGIAVFRVMHFLKTSGIRIPEDLSLITWEEGVFSELQQPPLTTVAQDFPALVRQALLVLTRVMQGGSVVKDISVPYLFYDRESVCRII